MSLTAVGTPNADNDLAGPLKQYGSDPRVDNNSGPARRADTGTDL